MKYLAHNLFLNGNFYFVVTIKHVFVCDKLTGQLIFLRENLIKFLQILDKLFKIYKQKKN